jgi:hypothetical protein
MLFELTMYAWALLFIGRAVGEDALSSGVRRLGGVSSALRCLGVELSVEAVLRGKWYQ